MVNIVMYLGRCAAGAFTFFLQIWVKCNTINYIVFCCMSGVMIYGKEHEIYSEEVLCMRRKRREYDSTKI